MVFKAPIELPSAYACAQPEGPLQVIWTTSYILMKPLLVNDTQICRKYIGLVCKLTYAVGQSSVHVY